MMQSKTKQGTVASAIKWEAGVQIRAVLYLLLRNLPQPDVVSGKIYQTVKLPAGSYTFRVDMAAANYGANPCMIIVAPGNVAGC